MQALLRNTSQRSTEKGSLKAEAGHLSTLKMEMEDCLQTFPRVSGAWQLHGHFSTSHAKVRRLSPGHTGSCHSKHEGQISQTSTQIHPSTQTSHRFCQHQAHCPVTTSRRARSTRRHPAEHLSVPSVDPIDGGDRGSLKPH